LFGVDEVMMKRSNKEERRSYHFTIFIKSDIISRQEFALY